MAARGWPHIPTHRHKKVFDEKRKQLESTEFISYLDLSDDGNARGPTPIGHMAEISCQRPTCQRISRSQGLALLHEHHATMRHQSYCQRPSPRWCECTARQHYVLDGEGQEGGHDALYLDDTLENDTGPGAVTPRPAGTPPEGSITLQTNMLPPTPPGVGGAITLVIITIAGLVALSIMAGTQGAALLAPAVWSVTRLVRAIRR